MPELVIAEAAPTEPDVHALLQRHLDLAAAHSRPEDRHALEADQLTGPEVTLFAAREAGVLLGIGALCNLGEGHAEIKSMHIAAPARRRGVGMQIVEHLVAAARTRGCTRISLETSTAPAFAPARDLYAAAGFEPCEPFGRYPSTSASICMTRWIDQATD